MLTSVLTAAAVAYAAIVAFMFFAQRSLMYQPGQNLASPADSGLAEMTRVDLTTDDGLRLQSWFHAPDAGQGVVVYFQGNAGHIGDRGFKVRPFLDAGYGVMLVGYRGYGGNPGSPTEDGLYRDAEAALSHLRAAGHASAAWILFGESLGTGIAVEMAQRLATVGTPAGAVILEAPFSAMGDAAQSHYPWLPAKWLVRDRYRSIDKIGSIAAPLLIYHGDADRVVPFALGQRLYAKAGEPKAFVRFEGGHHSDLYDHGAAAEILRFLVR